MPPPPLLPPLPLPLQPPSTEGSLPAAETRDPTCTLPFRNVPVVSTTAEAVISLPQESRMPTTRF